MAYIDQLNQRNAQYAEQNRQNREQNRQNLANMFTAMTKIGTDLADQLSNEEVKKFNIAEAEWQVNNQDKFEMKDGNYLLKTDDVGKTYDDLHAQFMSEYESSHKLSVIAKGKINRQYASTRAEQVLQQTMNNIKSNKAAMQKRADEYSSGELVASRIENPTEYVQNLMDGVYGDVYSKLIENDSYLQGLSEEFSNVVGLASVGADTSDYSPAVTAKKIDAYLTLMNAGYDTTSAQILVNRYAFDYASQELYNMYGDIVSAFSRGEANPYSGTEMTADSLREEIKGRIELIRTKGLAGYGMVTKDELNKIEKNLTADLEDSITTKKNNLVSTVIPEIENQVTELIKNGTLTEENYTQLYSGVDFTVLPPSYQYAYSNAVKSIRDYEDAQSFAKIVNSIEDPDERATYVLKNWDDLNWRTKDILTAGFSENGYDSGNWFGTTSDRNIMNTFLPDTVSDDAGLMNYDRLDLTGLNVKERIAVDHVSEQYKNSVETNRRYPTSEEIAAFESWNEIPVGTQEEIIESSENPTATTSSTSGSTGNKFSLPMSTSNMKKYNLTLDSPQSEYLLGWTYSRLSKNGTGSVDHFIEDAATATLMNEYDAFDVSKYYGENTEYQPKYSKITVTDENGNETVVEGNELMKLQAFCSANGIDFDTIYPISRTEKELKENVITALQYQKMDMYKDFEDALSAEAISNLDKVEVEMIETFMENGNNNGTTYYTGDSVRILSYSQAACCDLMLMIMTTDPSNMSVAHSQFSNLLATGNITAKDAKMVEDCFSGKFSGKIAQLGISDFDGYFKSRTGLDYEHGDGNSYLIKTAFMNGAYDYQSNQTLRGIKDILVDALNEKISPYDAKNEMDRLMDVIARDYKTAPLFGDAKILSEAYPTYNDFSTEWGGSYKKASLQYQSNNESTFIADSIVTAIYDSNESDSAFIDANSYWQANVADMLSPNSLATEEDVANALMQVALIANRQGNFKDPFNGFWGIGEGLKRDAVWETYERLCYDFDKQKTLYGLAPEIGNLNIDGKDDFGNALQFDADSKPQIVTKNGSTYNYGTLQYFTEKGFQSLSDSMNSYEDYYGFRGISTGSKVSTDDDGCEYYGDEYISVKNAFEDAYDGYTLMTVRDVTGKLVVYPAKKGQKQSEELGQKTTLANQTYGRDIAVAMADVQSSLLTDIEIRQAQDRYNFNTYEDYLKTYWENSMAPTINKYSKLVEQYGLKLEVKWIGFSNEGGFPYSVRIQPFPSSVPNAGNKQVSARNYMVAR